MPDELPVHVSRDGARELDVPASIEATGDFDVRFVNHGEALHVHLNTSERLSRVVTVDAGNRHVPGNGERRVHVDVDTDAFEGASVSGKLEVSTSYGAEQHWIDVELKDPAVARTTVEVDESLAEPPPERRSLLDRPELVVVGLAALALSIATVAALVVDATLVVLGVGVVFVGVLAAVVLLLR